MSFGGDRLRATEGDSFTDPSASASASASTSTSPSASKLLGNLPSRGLFSSSTTVASSNPDGMRVYVCEHDTAPPEGQVIRTNRQNILVRSLMLDKQRRGDSSSKSGKGVAIIEGSRKRASERLSDAASKRTNTQAGSHQEGSNTFTHLSDEDLHTLTVERLRALLKEKGLSARGKKDELIARLKR